MSNRRDFLKKAGSILDKIFTDLLLSIAVLVLLVSSIKLYSYNKEKNASQDLAKKVVVKSSSKENDVPVSVDFNTLTQRNSDIKAWLYSEDTPINYPVVQSDDNSYYLHRGIDRKYSSSGTLFIDCANKGDFTDSKTVIYGHNMKNGTMFASLSKYQNQDYFERHPKIYLLTPDKEYEIKLIAGFTANSKSQIYTLPLTEENKEQFVMQAVRKSEFKAEYTFKKNDRFVMLSTCSYVHNDARYVLVGVLNEN